MSTIVGFSKLISNASIFSSGLLTLVLLSPYLQHLDVSGCQHVTNVTVTACLDSVQARSSGKKLTLIAGGDP